MAAISSLYVTTGNPTGGKSDGVAVTGTETKYSLPFEIANGLPVSIHMDWTQTVATLTGTFTLWYTNKQGANTANDTDWVQDTSFPAPAVSGSGKAFISIANTNSLGVRLKYVNATGSGTLKTWAAVARAGA